MVANGQQREVMVFALLTNALSLPRLLFFPSTQKAPTHSDSKQHLLWTCL